MDGYHLNSSANTVKMDMISLVIIIYKLKQNILANSENSLYQRVGGTLI